MKPTRPKCLLLGDIVILREFQRPAKVVGRDLEWRKYTIEFADGTLAVHHLPELRLAPDQRKARTQFAKLKKVLEK